MSTPLEARGCNASVRAAVDPEDRVQYELARVVAVHRERYAVSTGESDIPAELMGKLLFAAASPLDYPAVGDWVLVTFYDDRTLALIHRIVARKSLLKRKTPGKKVDFQVIAANIEVAFIVQSLNENFNLRRLERYLVVVNESNIQPILLLSKSDLLTPEEIAVRVDDIQQALPELRVIIFSNQTGSGLDAVRACLQAGLTYCVIGSSGVGKTTLINKLVGQTALRTGTVSKKASKGRHVTTHRQLIRLDCGAMIVDTPGMRELGVFSVDDGIEGTFPEITALAEQCRFKDCTHVKEYGCAVLAGVDQGLLSRERYEHYLKMSRESAFNELSYVEKRRRDKDFGKHVKAVKKQKSRQR